MYLNWSADEIFYLCVDVTLECCRECFINSGNLRLELSFLILFFYFTVSRKQAVLCVFYQALKNKHNEVLKETAFFLALFIISNDLSSL